MLVRTLPSYWNGPLSGDIFIFGDVNLTKSTYLERQISIHFSWNTANDVETSNHLLCFKEVPQWLLEVSETVNSYLLVGLYGPCTPSTSQKLRIVAWIEKCGDVETPQDLENVALKHPEEIDEIGAYGICFKWVHIWISCNILYTEMVHVEKYWPTFPLACGHFWPSVEVEPPKLGGAKVNMFHVRTEQHWGNRFPNLTHCANIFQWQKTVWTSRDDSLELLMKSTLKAL